MESRENVLELMARRLEAHSALTPEDREALLQLPFKLRSLGRNSFMVREADTPTQCVMLLSGIACRSKLTASGLKQIVSLHIQGDALDLQNLFLDEADHNVQALTEVEIAIIPREALRMLSRSHESIGHAILVYTLVEASIFREWTLNVGRRDARGRVAHILCELAVRLDAQGLQGKDGYRLSLTQTQLADAAGLTDVHINRTLQSMSRDGLIKLEGRQITFPHWNKLWDAADYDPRYLHLKPQTDTQARLHSAGRAPL